MDARQTLLMSIKKTDGLASALTSSGLLLFKDCGNPQTYDKTMDGRSKEELPGRARRAKPTDHDLAELERLYDVALTIQPGVYGVQAAATTYGSLQEPAR